MFLLRKGLELVGRFVADKAREISEERKRKSQPMVFRVGEGLSSEPTVTGPGPTVAASRAYAAGEPVKVVPVSETGERVKPSVSERVVARETATKEPTVKPRTTPYNVDAGKVARSVFQLNPVTLGARALTSVALEPAAGITALLTGSEIKPVYRPKTGFERMILGDDPIVGAFSKVSSDSRSISALVQKMGADKDISDGAALAIAPLFVGGMLGLDLTPVGGGTKKLSEKTIGKIAVSRNSDEILSMLRKTYKNEEKALKPLAEALVAVKDPKDVSRILSNFSPSAVPTKPPDEAFNFDRLGLTDEEKSAAKALMSVRSEKVLSNKGVPLTHAEVRTAAREAAEEGRSLASVITREESERMLAADLQARQRIVTAGKVLSGDSPAGVKEAAFNDLLDAMEVSASFGTDAARRLQARRIAAEDLPVNRILERMRKAGVDMESVREGAIKVDWSDANAVSKFFREHVKPTFWEVLDEYRYNNMLSNPRTFARNAVSNALSALVVRPVTMGVEAGIDLAHYAASRGKIARDKRLGDVPRYFRDIWRAVPDSVGAFKDSFRGKSSFTLKDLEEKIPTGKLPGFFTIPTRALEATDQMLMTLVSRAEKARLLRNGASEAAAQKGAERVAAYSLFRTGLDAENKSGQGYLLSKLDEAIGWIDHGRDAVPGLKWFVPFVRTPANFAKQWVEYSPLGLLTLPGNARKKEQLAKVLVGSTLTAMGASLAMEDRTTWRIPSDPEAKALFFASGKKPFSVKVGDQWVPMMYFGPLAYALALPAAVQYHFQESPEAFTRGTAKKLASSLGSMSEFLAQQTFLEGLGNFVDILTGDEDASVEKMLAFNAGQFVPLNGLLRYVSTVVDDAYRKSDTFLETIQKDLPYLSRFLEPYRTPDGKVSRRNWTSYLAPYDVSREDEEYSALLRIREEQLRINAVLNSNDSETNERAMDILERFKSATSAEDMEAIKAELSGNETLKRSFEAMVRKQAFYSQSLVQPYYYLKDRPSAVAELVYGKFLLANSKQDMEDLNETIRQLKEHGIWNEKVSEKLKELAEEEALQGPLEPRR